MAAVVKMAMVILAAVVKMAMCVPSSSSCSWPTTFNVQPVPTEEIDISEVEEPVFNAAGALESFKVHPIPDEGEHASDCQAAELNGEDVDAGRAGGDVALDPITQATEDDQEPPGVFASFAARLGRALKKLNVNQLKAHLQANGLIVTGNKPALIERIVDGLVHKVARSCPSCLDGRPKWDRATGSFACPGHFDKRSRKFHRCDAHHPADALQLQEWRWSSVGVPNEVQRVLDGGDAEPEVSARGATNAGASNADAQTGQDAVDEGLRQCDADTVDGIPVIAQAPKRGARTLSASLRRTARLGVHKKVAVKLGLAKKLDAAAVRGAERGFQHVEKNAAQRRKRKRERSDQQNEKTAGVHPEEADVVERQADTAGQAPRKHGRSRNHGTVGTGGRGGSTTRTWHESPLAPFREMLKSLMDELGMGAYTLGPDPANVLLASCEDVLLEMFADCQALGEFFGKDKRVSVPHVRAWKYLAFANTRRTRQEMEVGAEIRRANNEWEAQIRERAAAKAKAVRRATQKKPAAIVKEEGETDATRVTDGGGKSASVSKAES